MLYIYLLLSRPDSPVQIPRYIMLSMSCCIVLIPLIDRLRPLKCTKHQHCPKPRLYAFHLDPILIPGHSILICWMSSRKHLLILPTWVLAIMSLTCNTNINNFFPHPSRYHYHQKHPLLPIFSKKTAPRSRTFVGKAPSFSDAKSKSSESPNICIFGSTIFWFFGRFTSQEGKRLDKWKISPDGKHGFFPNGLLAKWPKFEKVHGQNCPMYPQKKTTKQHRIAWWILKNWVVSCNAM